MLILTSFLLISLITGTCRRDEEGSRPTFLDRSYSISVTKTGTIIRSGALLEGSYPVTECGICWSIRENPTIKDSRTSDGTGSPRFTSNISGLIPGTLYYMRPYATSKAGTGYGDQIYIRTKAGEVTDIDGNDYSTVISGHDLTGYFEWMTENLRTTKLNDGSEITLVADNTEWARTSSPAFCWYANNITDSPEEYGVLYNWHAVNTGKLCPAGWHVATSNEWYSLIYPFDKNLQRNMATDYAGCGLVKPDSALAFGCNPDELNRSGLSAIRGGWRDYNGDFSDDRISSRFWLPEDYAATFTYTMHIYCSCNIRMIRRTYGNKRNGYSVRCVKN